MERATLRPVPKRPSTAVTPAEALAHVEGTLPELDAAAQNALALVELVGRSRPELPGEIGIDGDEVAAAIARARKALRRAALPLPGSGWCERAERLLSDELDGVLAEPGPRRLAAHLANCDRCVEHERRLWQARDQLVVGFEEARAAATPSPSADAPVVTDEPDAEALEVPDPEPVELPDPQPVPADDPEPTVETEPPPAAQPLATSTPELRLVEPAAEVPAPTIPQPGEPAPGAPEPAEPQPVEPEPAEPEPVAPAAERAAAFDDAGEAGLSLRGVAWGAAMAVAVLLAIVSLALTVFAIAGGGL